MDYSTISTSELVKMWEAERKHIALNDNRTIGDIANLLAMRKEIDRRNGEPKPVTDINFENYLTD